MRKSSSPSCSTPGPASTPGPRPAPRPRPRPLRSPARVPVPPHLAVSRLPAPQTPEARASPPGSRGGLPPSASFSPRPRGPQAARVRRRDHRRRATVRRSQSADMRPANSPRLIPGTGRERSRAGGCADGGAGALASANAASASRAPSASLALSDGGAFGGGAVGLATARPSSTSPMAAPPPRETSSSRACSCAGSSASRRSRCATALSVRPYFANTWASVNSSSTLLGTSGGSTPIGPLGGGATVGPVSACDRSISTRSNPSSGGAVAAGARRGRLGCGGPGRAGTATPSSFKRWANSGFEGTF